MFATLSLAGLLLAAQPPADPPLPKPGAVLSATVQPPEGKECINEFDGRIQPFVGCAKAAGGEERVVRSWALPGYAPGDPVAAPGKKPV